MTQTLASLTSALADRYRLERQRGEGGIARVYLKWCPFLAPLRGNAEFDRIVAKAARRVAEFSA